MRLTSTQWGGALSTFGKDIGWDGKSINEIFSFNTFGCTMDEASSILNIPKPDYIKIDVDGIEHIILSESEKILRNVQGVLVEINENFTDQLSISKEKLEQSGLSLIDKRHSELFENSKFSSLFNQIWYRKKK